MRNQSPKNPAGISASADEWRRQALSRSNCYGLLALVFRDAPTSDVVAQLRAPPLAEALSRLGYDVGQDLSGELEEVTERLREEYTRIFVGPGPHVSPYASVHDRDEGRLWGDSTVRVKRFVEATGLSFEGHWDSIPDHIAIELELMQRLTAHEAQLWAQRATVTGPGEEKVDQQLDRCFEAEEAFLRDHLCRWVPQFCDHVVKISTTPFYRQMAGLTKSVVLADVEQVTAARSALRCAS